MIVVERAALRRVTTPVSMRSCSSGKLANSGTAFRTAVETVVAIAEKPSLLRPNVSRTAPYNFSAHVLSAEAPLPSADSRLGTGRLHRGGLRRPRQPAPGARHRHRAGRPADDH